MSVLLEKVPSRHIMNGAAIEGRILTCSYTPLFSVKRSGCQELESDGRDGEPRRFSHPLWCYNPLQPAFRGLATPVSKHYIHTVLCSEAGAIADQNLDFQIFRKRTDLQETLRPENWVWSKLLWQHFIPARNIHSHWFAQRWWSRWWCWYGIQQSCHILCCKSQWFSSIKHFTQRKVKLADWLIAQRV